MFYHAALLATRTSCPAARNAAASGTIGSKCRVRAGG